MTQATEEKRVCTCASCGSCGGTGNVWFTFDGKYLGNHRCDDLDELQRCDDCEGSGLSDVCELCAYQEEDDEY